MSNIYFNNTNPLISGTTARAGQVNGTENAVAAAFDEVQADMFQAFRTVGRSPGEANMQIPQNAAATANKLIGFNSAGDSVQLYPITPNVRGAWVTITAYNIGDLVSAGVEQSLYYCIVPHTSGVFATDLANGDWVKLIDNTAAYQSKYNPQIITANYGPATPGDDLLVDVSSSAITILLPSAPTLAGSPIGVTHIGGPVATNPITILHNGNKIMGVLDDMQITTPNASAMLGWSNATFGWRLIRGT